MDEQLAIREKTKEHYNQHVDEGVSTAQALRARRQGPAAPLKLFHNEIKRRLIYRFAYQAESLLDYACGRGGDIHKWKSAQVRYVRGLDLSPKEVAEAKRRYLELVEKEPSMGLRCVFDQTDLLGLELVQEAQAFDVITCMFALHYFFVNEATCKMMMATIAANLREGGYFIACVPDGKRVKAHLKKDNGEVTAPHLRLKQIWEGKDSPFGSAYVMTIPDTVVEGHEGFSEGSEEFLVFDKVLLGVARAHGLQPVSDFADPALDALFEEADAGKPMKHFNPHYPPDTDISLALASKLYMAFVLQKVSSPEAAAAPPRPPPEHQRPAGARQQQQQQQQGGGGGGRSRRSPTRAERYGQLGGAAAQQQQQQQPPLMAMQQQPQQQQQQQQAWRGGGGGGRARGADWQLPYAAHVLPPAEMPSAYFNIRHLAQREHLGRFVIKLPPLPYTVGPPQWDQNGHPLAVLCPSYDDELRYHAQQQQQQQQAPIGPPQAAAAGPGAGAMQQQQQQQVPGRSGPGRPPGPAPDKQQQQQGAAGFPPPPQQQQSTPAAAAAADGDADPGSKAAAGGSAGRGRGRGRGRAAGAGTKRSRASVDGGGSSAGGAAEPAAEQAPPAAKRAAGGGGGRGGGRGAARGPMPDPLGYKVVPPAELPVLSPEAADALARLGPRYADE